MENPQIELAQKIVERAFKDKTDKSGKPYIGHINRVSSNFKDTIKISAILHDLLEDCPHWTEDALRNLFTNREVDIVVTLTKLKKESYEDYIERVSQDYWAKQIKIKDLEDNMNITRLNELTDKDIERLKKYHKAYLKLTLKP